MNETKKIKRKESEEGGVQFLLDIFVKSVM